MDNEFSLRFAESEEDRQAVYRLRYELYVEDQDLFQEEADHEHRWLYDSYDAKATILMAESEGKIVATMRAIWGAVVPFAEATREEYDLGLFDGVVDEADIMVMSRLLVRKEFRGTMITFQLIWKAWEYAGECGAELIIGSCEPHLLSHYRQFGFRPYSKLYNHPTNGILIPIVVVAGDLDHLRKIESPMLSPLSLRPEPSVLVDKILPLLSEDVAVQGGYEGGEEDYFVEVLRLLAIGEKELSGILGDHEETLVLLAKSHILTCEQGDTLIYTGHVSRTLYILLSGSVEVVDNGQVVAKVDKTGALFGEVALFSGKKRMCDVVVGPNGARVLALNNSTLLEIIQSYGTVTAKFFRYVIGELCGKLQQRSEAVIQAENQT